VVVAVQVQVVTEQHLQVVALLVLLELLTQVAVVVQVQRSAILAKMVALV
jgi:hypothetical protein